MSTPTANRLPSWLAPAGDRINAWFDMPGDRAVLVLLALFVVVWTAFQTVSFATVALHVDVVEVYAWGRHPSAGYPKHPPLGGLMAALWFAIFPAADWSAHLLAMVNAAAALFFADLIARRYLSGEKRLLVLLFLMLTPFYQFHAVRFASNQVLLLTWPLAVYCFIRSFESRTAYWGAAAGAAAGLAMLAKYFSIWLVAALLVAALVHPDRRAYLRSASPWAAVAVGLAVLAPHVHWLWSSGFLPFQYAVEVHGYRSLLDALTGAVNYSVGGFAYVALPVALIWWASQASLRELLAALWPQDARLRMLAVLFWVPLLLPPLLVPVFNLRLTALWTMQGWFLMPVLLLAPASIRIQRQRAVAVAGCAAVIAAAVLAISPALAWIRHVQDSREAYVHHKELASELTRRWRELTGRPLTIVGGNPDLALATTFYSADHPDSLSLSKFHSAPWVTEERARREGFAAACFARDPDCIAHTDQYTAGWPGLVRAQFDPARRLFGVAPHPVGFLIWLAPPRPQ